jgi:hypothetical protein
MKNVLAEHHIRPELSPVFSLHCLFISSNNFADMPVTLHKIPNEV